MMIILFVITLLIIGIIIIFRKNDNSCLGKACKSDSDCCFGTNTCLNGKCCSTDCKGKNCSQTNTCGQICACNEKEVCFEGNCCNPECLPNTCTDNGCGGQCQCDPEYTCVINNQGEKICCQPPDCATGTCKQTPCGTCECKDIYCDSDVGCCVSDKCSYTDICHKNFGKILGNSWAKFCKTCSFPTDHCNLILPQFHPGSFIPKSGTIHCSSCMGNTISDVEIDSNASYYDYNPTQNKIVPSYFGNYCKDSSGVCNSTCVCMKNEDCVVYGCTTCTGGFCS